MKLIYNKMRLVEVQNEMPFVQNTIGYELEVSFNDMNISDWNCYLLFETPTGEISPRLVMTRNKDSYKIVLTEHWFTAFYGIAKVSFLLTKNDIELITTAYPIAILEAVDENKETTITLDEYSQLNETINAVDLKIETKADKKDYNETKNVVALHSNRLDELENNKADKIEVNKKQDKLTSESQMLVKSWRVSEVPNDDMAVVNKLYLETAISTKADKSDVESIKKDLVSVYRFRGSYSIADFNLLPNKQIGDVFSINEPFSLNMFSDGLVSGYDYPMGTNIALYDNEGTRIDVFSGILNLENYYNKQEIDYKFDNLKIPEGSGGASYDDTQIKEDLSQLTDNLEIHKNNSTIHVTKSDKDNWNAKSNFTGNYNDLTNKPTIPTKVSDLFNDSGYITQHQDISGKADKTYVVNEISTHNTNNKSHSDIRNLINELTTRLNTLADSSDDDLNQLSEIVAYIKNNKSLIESVTSSKVNVDDIVNNLTTTATNKPLSANQGVVLKGLIDAIKVPTKTSDLTNDSGFLTQHQSLTDYAKKSEIPTKLSQLTGDASNRLVTDTEKSNWNNKSNFTGNYNDLTNKPTIPTYTAGTGISISNGVISCTFADGNGVTY